VVPDGREDRPAAVVLPDDQQRGYELLIAGS